jgi:hypothetical protein
MAEAVAEAELISPLPAPLMEGPAGSEKAAASAQKVAEWLRKRQASLEKIRAEYRAVVEQTQVTVEGKRQASRYWSTAAAARLGFATELFAAEALAVRTDKVAPAPALQAALQDLVATHRAPRFAQAAAYYRECLGGGRSQVGHGEWALLCEGRLQAMDPAGWAASRRTASPANPLAAQASSGTLDVATWNRALAGPRTTALRCLAAPGGPKARQATVTLRIGQDGALVAPPVIKGLEKEPPVATCVLTALKTLTLPAHGEPPQTVTLPLLPLPAASAGLPAQILATFAAGR